MSELLSTGNSKSKSLFYNCGPISIFGAMS